MHICLTTSVKLSRRRILLMTLCSMNIATAAYCLPQGLTSAWLSVSNKSLEACFASTDVRWKVVDNQPICQNQLAVVRKCLTDSPLDVSYWLAKHSKLTLPHNRQTDGRVFVITIAKAACLGYGPGLYVGSLVGMNQDRFTVASTEYYRQFLKSICKF